MSRAKFRSDVAWNVASLAVLAVAGLTLNIVIGERWGPASLGVFNQALSAYVLFSMAASLGLDRAALRAVAAAGPDGARAAEAGLAALVWTVALALPVAALYALLGGPIAALLESPGVARAIQASAPGLACFALNKVLLGIVNGAGRLRAFALYQSLRYVLILVALGAFALAEVDGDLLAGVFSVAEGTLLAVLLVDLSRTLWPAPPGWRGAMRGQLAFGVKSAGAGVLLELNAKVDLWMLGIYLNDARVGVYAYAAMFAEGLYQLLVALQNVYNPHLARLLALGKLGELHELVKRGRWRAGLATLAAGGIGVLAYPHALELVGVRAEFLESARPFAILVAGIVLASPWLPFGQILLMGNRPGWHTVLLAASVGLNLIGNALLIPRIGLEGAAYATAAAMLGWVILLHVLARRTLSVRL